MRVAALLGGAGFRQDFCAHGVFVDGDFFAGGGDDGGGGLCGEIWRGDDGAPGQDVHVADEPEGAEMNSNHRHTRLMIVLRFIFSVLPRLP